MINLEVLLCLFQRHFGHTKTVTHCAKKCRLCLERISLLAGRGRMVCIAKPISSAKASVFSSTSKRDDEPESLVLAVQTRFKLTDFLTALSEQVSRAPRS